MTMVVLFIFVPVLVAILLALNVLLAVHRPDTEKVTPYECGFNPNLRTSPSSVRYSILLSWYSVLNLRS